MSESNNEVALRKVYELRVVMDEQEKELRDYCADKKKYKGIIVGLDEWIEDGKKFLKTVEKDLQKLKYNKENRFRIAVYLGRYPSLFSHLSNQDNSKEEEIRSRYNALLSISEQVKNYLKELKRGQ